MKKEIIGHVVCPVCDHEHAEVKEDKNGHAFIFCPDCAAQCFTRNEYRDKHLRRRMRPVTVTVTEQKPSEPTEPIQPVAVPNIPPKPKGKPSELGPEPELPPVPAPPAPKKKAGWFTPILAGGDE